MGAPQWPSASRRSRSSRRSASRCAPRASASADSASSTPRSASACLDGGGAPAEFALAFEVFDCVARARAGSTARDVDFVLEGPLAAWREMLDTIHALGAADTAHSMNTLTHFGERCGPLRRPRRARQALPLRARASRSSSTSRPRVDFAYPDGSAPPARARTPCGGAAHELSQHDRLRRGPGLRRPLPARACRATSTSPGWTPRASRCTCRPQNERRGLTFRDLDVGALRLHRDAGADPREPQLRAARRRACPSGLPDLQAEVNRKSEVWAYNVEGYYEEAMTRQWNATTDIPWAELRSHRAARGDRQGVRAAAHLPHRGRDDRHRRPGEVDGTSQRRLLRGEELHRHAGDGRGAPRRGLPQARALHRLRPHARQPRTTSTT